MEVNSQGRKILLFLYTNMAAMTLHALPSIWYFTDLFFPFFPSPPLPPFLPFFFSLPPK